MCVLQLRLDSGWITRLSLYQLGDDTLFVRTRHHTLLSILATHKYVLLSNILHDNTDAAQRGASR